MTSTSVAKCQFIGQHSDHFVSGRWYDLEIINTLLGKVIATPTRGFDYIPMSDMSVKYVSLHHFLHDWRIEELLHQSYWHGGVAREI